MSKISTHNPYASQSNDCLDSNKEKKKKKEKRSKESSIRFKQCALKDNQAKRFQFTHVRIEVHFFVRIHSHQYGSCVRLVVES